MLKSLFRIYSSRSRRRRARLFLERMRPTEKDLIMDLGSEDGKHIASVVPFRENVYLADIDQECMNRGKEKYGFKHSILLDESGVIPVPDKYFDIVFCSSVIEHVTVDKEDIDKYKTNAEFAAAALERQRRFAEEIRRVAKRYFVQTPNKFFWIESHSWLPGCLVMLPRTWQAAILRVTNRFWPKKANLDFHLLTRKVMQELFPDAEIVEERSLGLTKSLMAIKS